MRVRKTINVPKALQQSWCLDCGNLLGFEITHECFALNTPGILEAHILCRKCRLEQNHKTKWVLKYKLVGIERADEIQEIGCVAQQGERRLDKP